MARRISFVNFKGGVGKTSLTVNIAAFLAHEFNQRVLLVDMDAQSNASFWLLGAAQWNKVNKRPERSVYSVFMNDAGAPPLHLNIVKHLLPDANGAKQIPKLDLLPACYELMELEHAPLNSDKPFYLKFYEELSAVYDYYDYILFDCPPNVFRACQAAVFASQEIYVPCNPDELSYAGLSLLARKIEAFQDRSLLARNQIDNYQLAKIRGAVFNGVVGTANVDDMIQRIRTKIIQLRESKVVSPDADTVTQRIRHAVLVGQSVAHHLPIVLDKRNQNLYQDFENLTRFIHTTPLYQNQIL